jgi:hypothetical protein
MELFRNFLVDPIQYRACQRFWESMVLDVASEVGDREAWRTRIATYADGSPLAQDGNPIYEAWSEALDRSLRIIQHEPMGPAVEFAAWVDDEPPGSLLPRHDLAINLSLSAESAELARRLIRSWLQADTSSEAMRSVIARLQSAP